jgi:hypothetical protein
VEAGRLLAVKQSVAMLASRVLTDQQADQLELATSAATACTWWLIMLQLYFVCCIQSRHSFRQPWGHKQPRSIGAFAWCRAGSHPGLCMLIIILDCHPCALTRTEIEAGKAGLVAMAVQRHEL